VLVGQERGAYAVRSGRVELHDGGVGPGRRVPGRRRPFGEVGPR
jgi:hypothetical protein